MDKSTQIPPDSLTARLKQAMAMRNLKQETLAEAAGVSQNAIYKLTSGEAQSTRRLVETAAALGASSVQLRADEGTPAARGAVFVADNSPLVLELLHPRGSDIPLDEDEVELPLYKEVETSAGAGRTAVRETERRRLRLSSATPRVSGVDPSAAIYAQLTDNSVRSLIVDSSTISVDVVTTHAIGSGVYALEHDSMLQAEFIYHLPSGDIRLRSFNREGYPDEEYSPGGMRSRQISMIDWVFWWSTVCHRCTPSLVQWAPGAYPHYDSSYCTEEQPELYLLQRRVVAGGSTVQLTIAPTTPISHQGAVESTYYILDDALIPLGQIRERWFHNLSKKNLNKALTCGRITLPVTTFDDSHKAVQFVILGCLTAYADQRTNRARDARRAQPGTDSIAS